MSNLFSFNASEFANESNAIAGALGKLPMHIGKKHLLAAMKKAIREAKGVSVLRKLTPPRNMKRGRKKKDGRGPTGDLRRAVIVKAKWIGTNKSGVAVAGVGYKYGHQSRKAIWLEFGTNRGIEPQRFTEQAFAIMAPAVRANLVAGMATAIEKATKELNSGKNPGMSKRGLAMGVPPR